MEAIAVLPYYKVERKVTEQGQQCVQEMRELSLYADRVCTRHREFAISDVFDVSARSMGGNEILLYLHTSTGVYPYNVRGDAEDFISIFKDTLQSARARL